MGVPIQGDSGPCVCGDCCGGGCMDGWRPMPPPFWGRGPLGGGLPLFAGGGGLGICPLVGGGLGKLPVLVSLPCPRSFHGSRCGSRGLSLGCCPLLWLPPSLWASEGVRRGTGGGGGGGRAGQFSPVDAGTSRSLLLLWPVVPVPAAAATGAAAATDGGTWDGMTPTASGGTTCAAGWGMGMFSAPNDILEDCRSTPLKIRMDPGLEFGFENVNCNSWSIFGKSFALI
mmetsp:Transcript_10757/g.37656  ORF Transcript_10757/g.37656 Transcript_10757/m.37656 type:complete len:228 (-) Transcript_10757:966-1649(-)